MDATEIAALVALGLREVWPVDYLPESVTVDILRALDAAELIEARAVILTNMNPAGSGPRRPIGHEWFSPIKNPWIAGDWDVVFSKRSRVGRDWPFEVRLNDRGKARFAQVARTRNDYERAASVLDHWRHSIDRLADRLHVLRWVMHGLSVERATASLKWPDSDDSSDQQGMCVRGDPAPLIEEIRAEGALQFADFERHSDCIEQLPDFTTGKLLRSVGSWLHTAKTLDQPSGGINTDFLKGLVTTARNELREALVDAKYATEDAAEKRRKEAALTAIAANALRNPESGKGNRTSGTKIRQRKATQRSMADKVRELLGGAAPYEKTKSQLAEEVGYTHQAALSRVKNFHNLWLENGRKLAARRAESQGRMRPRADD